MNKYLIFIPLLLSCSRDHGSPASSAGAPAVLPAAWYQQSAPSRPETEPLPEPDAATADAVQTAFDANLSALDSVAELAPAVFDASARPADWVPWHLDGMSASFAISQGGIFGALLFNGTEAFKATWQKHAAPVKKRASVKFSSRTSPAEVNRQLDEVAGKLLRSGSVRNESSLRAGLRRESGRFLAISRGLDGLPRAGRWRVDGFQLALAVNAQGQVTPSLGVGGQLSLIFDWNVTPGAPAASLPPEGQKLRELVTALAAELPAQEHTPELERSGLRLDIIQAGLGISAGGDIGIVQASASAVGRVIFKRDFSSVAEIASHVPIELVTAFGSRELPASRLHRGISKAVKMASFFVNAANRSEGRKYDLTQVEAEFDFSLGGDLKLATVTGIGQLVLDFDRVTAGEVL